MPSWRVRIALFLCLFAAALDILGFIGFGLFPLTWIALVPALFAVREETPNLAFLYGLIFGAVANAGGYYWVAHMLSEFGGINDVLGYLGLALICTYQGLSFALLFYLVRRAKIDLGIAPIWSLAVAYPAVEFVFPLLFPYFIGASQYRFSAITQIVEVLGLLSLTMLIGLVTGAFYELVEARIEKRKPSVRRLLVALGAFGLVLAYGLIRLPMVDAKTAAAKKIKVALIQANLGAGEKQEKASEFIERHREMSRQVAREHPEVDLIVWPETAYNTRVLRTETDYRPRIGQGIDKPMVIGVLTYERRASGGADFYNTAVLTSSSGRELSRFDKVNLLAFGETVPFVDTFPALAEWFPHSSIFARGRSLAPLKGPLGRLLPMICYEDIFPAFVRQMWQAGGPSDALINLTNDSWYGDSHEPLIHLALATFRSIETRRALIRSTNTGISAIVDPAGRIASRSGQWTKEVLIADVPLITDGSTPLYQRIGDLLGWLCLGCVGYGGYRSWRLRKKPARAGKKKR